MSRTAARDRKVFRLTLRRAALLYTLRHNLFPWEPSSNKADRDGASRSAAKPGRWVMSCGHWYAEEEIQQMVRLGWVTIEEARDWSGEPQPTTEAERAAMAELTQSVSRTMG